MKAASQSEIKRALKDKSPKELLDYCLHLSRFKKENKELLTYLVFEADYEEGYIESVKTEIETQFDSITALNLYYIKKSVRKIQRQAKKYIRYSKKPVTEIEILLFFCEQMKDFKINLFKNKMLYNMYYREIDLIKRKIEKLDDDLKFDYSKELENLMQG